jgi:hypothetical protein
MAQSFCDLRVWHKGMNLTIEVYRLTAEFPKHELFGLTQPMRRAGGIGSLASQIGRSLSGLINSLAETVA